MNHSFSKLLIGLAGAAILSVACASRPEQDVTSGMSEADVFDTATSREMTLSPAQPEYFADIEVIRGASARGDSLFGVVFHDLNANGRRDDGEPGVAGVLVSNGRDVVRTGDDGRYELGVRNDMSVFVIQPSGWRTPTDRNWIPKFSYEHKPAGSPKPLRFGGLPPTGPLPSAVNFPLRPAASGDSVSCMIVGDVQSYNNLEVGYFRDSVVANVVGRDDRPDCAVFVGDVVGDDLDLLPRLQSVGSAMQIPQYYVHGNHDFDFDADFDADSADSWRRLYGPSYYAFETGGALFIALDNVVYPCGADDARLPGREFCLSPERKNYNGRVTEEQLTWLSNLLEQTPHDRPIILLHHIPFVSFVDHASTQHQTDNLADIHALIGKRQAISFSGHTHTLEVMEAGDSFAGWLQAVGVNALPFRHVIAGAASGAWWNGDFDMDGVPMSLSRLGEPRGYVILDVDPSGYSLDFVPLGMDPSRKMALSLNTPGFRHWFETILSWRAKPDETRDPVPPLSLNDLPDVKLLTPEDLAGGVFLTANVWLAATSTEVTVSLNGAAPVAMTRTQAARGEAPLIGSAYADPYAAMRQLSVGRAALQSRSGNEAAQGVVGGRRLASGPRPPQPTGVVTDRSMHLWRYQLPADMAPGTYTATVTAITGSQTFADSFVFEMVTERPQPDWRADVWAAFTDGRPVH